MVFILEFDSHFTSIFCLIMYLPFDVNSIEIIFRFFSIFVSKTFVSAQRQLCLCVFSHSVLTHRMSEMTSTLNSLEFAYVMVIHVKTTKYV